jgi:hypothetical protein
VCLLHYISVVGLTSAVLRDAVSMAPKRGEQITRGG